MGLTIFCCSDGDYLVREWSPIRIYDIKLNEMAVTYVDGYIADVDFPWQLVSISNLKPTIFKIHSLCHKDVSVVQVKEIWDFNRSQFIYQLHLQLNPEQVIKYDGTFEEAVNEQKGMLL